MSLYTQFPDVKPAQGGGYFVHSASQVGVWYELKLAPVDGSTVITCSCPAGRARPGKACRHVRRLHARTKAENALHARPTPPPNVAALVD